MYCKKCGKPIDNNAKFCSSCGNQMYQEIKNDEPSKIMTEKPKVKSNLALKITVIIMSVIILVMGVFLSIDIISNNSSGTNNSSNENASNIQDENETEKKNETSEETSDEYLLTAEIKDTFSLTDTNDTELLNSYDIDCVGLKEENQMYFIALIFTEEGTDAFADATADNIGKVINICIDGTVISAPTVNEAITDSTAFISSNYDYETALDFFNMITK